MFYIIVSFLPSKLIDTVIPCELFDQQSNLLIFLIRPPSIREQVKDNAKSTTRLNLNILFYPYSHCTDTEKERERQRKRVCMRERVQTRGSGFSIYMWCGAAFAVQQTVAELAAADGGEAMADTVDIHLYPIPSSSNNVLPLCTTE